MVLGSEFHPDMMCHIQRNYYINFVKNSSFDPDGGHFEFAIKTFAQTATFGN